MEAENLSKNDYNERIKRKDEFMDNDTINAIKKYNLVKCYDLDNFDNLNEEFIKIYHDKTLMLNYNNLKIY